MSVIGVYLRLPTCCKVQIAKGSGNLREGITLTVGYPPFTRGSLTLKFDERDVILEYSFDAFGLHYGGRLIGFSFP